MSFTDRSTAVAWCDAELSNLVDATERAAERGEHEITWRFAAVLWNYFYLRKPFDDTTLVAAVEIALGSAPILKERLAS